MREVTSSFSNKEEGEEAAAADCEKTLAPPINPSTVAPLLLLLFKQPARLHWAQQRLSPPIPPPTPCISLPLPLDSLTTHRQARIYTNTSSPHFYGIRPDPTGSQLRPSVTCSIYVLIPSKCLNGKRKWER